MGLGVLGVSSWGLGIKGFRFGALGSTLSGSQMREQRLGELGGLRVHRADLAIGPSDLMQDVFRASCSEFRLRATARLAGLKG